MQTIEQPFSYQSVPLLPLMPCIMMSKRMSLWGTSNNLMAASDADYVSDILYSIEIINFIIYT